MLPLKLEDKGSDEVRVEHPVPQARENARFNSSPLDRLAVLATPGVPGSAAAIACLADEDIA
jgi:hypothetical protein